MQSFGKQSGGGRRKSKRVDAPLPAVVTSLVTTHTAILVDVSTTGARLRGDSLPGVGEGVLIRVDSADAFGTVSWAEGDERGVQFEAPLTAHQVSLLHHSGIVACVSNLSPEERFALADWTSGLAR